MAGRCEERITSPEQAAGRIAVAWNHFQSGVPARYSVEPAVRAFEQFIGAVQKDVETSKGRPVA